MLSGRIENFKDYSKFSSIKKFNNTIEMFLADHKKDFTKGELIAFKRLVRFSAKYYGVANAKIGTILKAINEKMNDFGISRSTFERMLRKARTLGILTVENTVRSKGGQGHNVYVFNTIDVPSKNKLTYREHLDKSSESKDEQSKNEKESINLLETSNKKQESNNINKQAISQAILNRVNDAIKEGTTIKYISSYIDRVFRSIENQALHDANNRQVAIKKKREKESLAALQNDVPFYNWLEQ
ncbi:hypothetical protein SAMN05443252_1179 [Bacillus sp. OV322]|uniref:hypothetical protein n=1 Tax=Bacillus sp. OV322 TaxID=1882764 RepID=UPI0008EB99F1|nr:hypothetical protein [Bacillus sp. OV322]SFD03496.1 hypothetical protein SAMN05443252_1179 [Bacillus sp. OV322]